MKKVLMAIGALAAAFQAAAPMLGIDAGVAAHVGSAVAELGGICAALYHEPPR